MQPFLLLAVGLLMIFLEFYLPGGVMGTIGGVIVIASLVLFVSQTDSLLAVIAYVVGVTVVLMVLFRFALWRIQNAPPDKSIYSSGDQEGYVASNYDRSAIGKTGVVTTDLKPGGHVSVDGKKYLALSQSGYVTKGEAIEVIGGEGESLIVKRVKKD